MNYLIARVSDPEQKKALPAQKKRLLDYAERLRWKEKEDYAYVEFDETAYKEDRRDFQKLVIEPISQEKELSIAVFDKIDRFSRDSSSIERAALTKLFREGKIELHFPSDNLYIHKDSPAADLFRLDIGVALAGYYSSAIRDNVKRRFDQMLNDGIWVGRAPLGYINTQKLDESGKVIAKGVALDPDRHDLIRKGFELRSTGLPYKSIAKQLKKDGLRSRKTGIPISAPQWEQIINNPFYVGTMRYNGGFYPHYYPRIVEQWLWDKCINVKNSRSGIGKTQYNSKPFLFKKLRCHDCGYSISFDGPKANGMTYGICTEYGGKHGAIRINESILYDQVRELLKSIHIPKDVLPDVIAEIEQNHESEQEHYKNTKARLQKEYDDLDVDLQDLFKDRKQFKSRPDIFEKMVKDVEVKQKDLLEQLNDHSDGDKAFIIGASYILDVCSRAIELFDAESSKLDEKRYLLDFVLSNMTLDKKILRFTVKKPFDAVRSMQKTGNWLRRLDSNQ